MTRRWRHRPPGSNWGEFGDDDEVGRLNLLTPEVIRAATAEVVEGRTFVLSLPLDLPGGNVLNPARVPPRVSPTRRGDEPVYLRSPAPGSGCTDVTCDDQATLVLQYSTHWDALAHVGSMFDVDGDGTPEPVFYNGFRGGHDVAHGLQGAEPWSRADRLGIDRMASRGVQGRGVLVDLLAEVGAERVAVGYDPLMRVLEAQRVEVERGDLLCIYTGFADAVVRAAAGAGDLAAVARSYAVLDGFDERLLDWLDTSGIAGLVADNYAIEARPFDHDGDLRGPLLPLHERCIFKLGLPLGELWWFEDLAAWLAARHRTRFLLTATPLRLPGAVGSPVTPLATV